MPKPAAGQPRGAAVRGTAARTAQKAAFKPGAVTADGKNAAAVALGRKGGLARAARLSKERRGQIALAGAEARWHKQTGTVPAGVSLLSPRSAPTVRGVVDPETADLLRRAQEARRLATAATHASEGASERLQRALMRADARERLP
jgi:hypothetical protein